MCAVQVQIEPIGVVHSCFTEKFGIPRQSGLVSGARAVLELFPPFNREEMVRGLESFSHIWVHFIFHGTVAEGWRPTVRPPWLGGKRRVGVFATRSPHRPNHLGLSVVRLESIENRQGGCVLHVSGVDLLDGTPVVDIKPYLPYADRIEEAQALDYGRGESFLAEVVFAPQAEQFCRNYVQETGRDLAALIGELVGKDPRPASQKGNKNSFGMRLWDVDVHWQVIADRLFQVTGIVRVSTDTAAD